MKKANILIVIPARGGSKGIPRKNLRSLSGKPLISYSIKTALSSRFNPCVVVSSDDDEIISISRKLGAKTIKRDLEDALDAVTLDPVIYKAYLEMDSSNDKDYDLIVTLQPTSPVLKSETLDKAIQKILNDKDLDTVISGINDTHLTWGVEEGKFVPNYEKRLNRQQLPASYKETGSFLITRPNIISESNRIGKRVEIYTLPENEAVDIDTYADWSLCEYYLRRKKVLFVVAGYTEIGLGHVYNTLLIANDLLAHEVVFLVDKKSKLAFDKILINNYKVQIQEKDNIVDDIISINPDVVINDRLDTTEAYISELKKQCFKVINFEDLGRGAALADMVINAIYPESNALPNHYFGHNYFVLRDEFMLTKPYLVLEKVSSVLLSFGGVDPNDFTDKTLHAIYGFTERNKIKIKVITGFGYKGKARSKSYPNVEILRNVQNISDHMAESDVVFTSAGRTTYELASLHVPTIVLAQNEREMTHLFASAEQGFVNMGLGITQTPEDIRATLESVVNNFEHRKNMSELMKGCNLTTGRKTVANLIIKAIEE